MLTKTRRVHKAKATLEKVAKDQAAALRKISKRKAARRAKKDSDKQRWLLKRTGEGGVVAPKNMRGRKIGEDGNE